MRCLLDDDSRDHSIIGCNSLHPTDSFNRSDFILKRELPQLLDFDLSLLKPSKPPLTIAKPIYQIKIEDSIESDFEMIEIPEIELSNQPSRLKSIGNVFTGIYSTTIGAGRKVVSAYTFITTPAPVAVKEKAKVTGSSATLKIIHSLIHSTVVHVILASIFLPESLILKGLVAILSYIFNSLDSSKENKTVIDRLVDKLAEKVFIPLSEAPVFGIILNGFAKFLELFPIMESIINLALLIKPEHLNGDKAKTIATTAFSQAAELEKELANFQDLIDPNLSYKEKIVCMTVLLQAALETGQFEDKLAAKIDGILKKIEKSDQHFQDIVAVLGISASKKLGKTVQYLTYAVNKIKKRFAKDKTEISAQETIAFYQNKALFLPFVLI